MRLALSLSSLLIGLAGAAVFILYNSFFMCMVGQVTYAPPQSSNALRDAFSALSRETSNTPGVTLGGVADARVVCLNVSLPPDVAEGVRRLNLVLLGAGARSLSRVIAPEARRLTALRPDLTEEAGVNFVTLSERQAAVMSAELATLSSPNAPIYRDLDLSGGVLQESFRLAVIHATAINGGLRRCSPAIW